MRSRAELVTPADPCADRYQGLDPSAPCYVAVSPLDPVAVATYGVPAPLGEPNALTKFGPWLLLAAGAATALLVMSGMARKKER